MKKHFTTIILIFIFCIGLSLLLYPTLSDIWNSYHQSKAIVTYAEMVEDIDEETYKSMWDDAALYNQRLAQTGNRWKLSDAEEKEYERILRVNDSGMMAYLEIPKINCRLPVYHGTDELVLQTAVGHLEGTSLPVGGESSHCVLSGHRGLPSAKLFTNLDKLEVGDTFTLRTLDEVLTYEVDQILIVKPDEVDALKIVDGEDYCTLVTCTPYGINTHRLLVRGHRTWTDNPEEFRVSADALQTDPMIVALVIAALLCLFLLFGLLVSARKKKKK